MVREARDDLDQVLRGVVEREGGVPGVVAAVTDRRGDLYVGAEGECELGSGRGMTEDTVFCLFSCTKAITGVAVMQLVEEGRLDLDDPVKEYLPEISRIEVLEGFDGEGEPITRPARSEITVRHLMLHTAGFGYEFFNHDLLEYYRKREVPSVVSGREDALYSVLLFDPGERWEYGINMDWAGKVVEAVRGRRLGEVFEERIFEPLGMEDTAITMSRGMRERRATVHQRQEDGRLRPMPGFELPQDPEQHMGGHALYGTVGDYTRFIRMMLNDGGGEDGRVLAPETVRYMSRNGLGRMKIHALPGAVPSLSNDAEFFPGMPKSWGYTFMINDEDAPTGRPAGSLGWAGLANLYYWIDRKNGIGGFWATQLFPFADPASFGAYLEFEKKTYEHLGDFLGG
ncbi:serine hydrolase domain-containing protein [Rubrobacter calidifluminis]|uniref:serine hydrolase domain-containing protein n=1 Tax=Rubrobacter calidifluminis TaxID=1392640 RepID=UPI00236025DD|nr:serine hydrolase domain-containing protein [Rubrobacter calidifluminis]